MTNGPTAGKSAAIPQFRVNAAALWAVAALLILIMIISSGFAQAPSSTPDRTDVAANDLVHYGDLIDVDVLGSLDGDWRGTVDPEGFLQGLIYAPGPVFALCKTEKAIADDITAQYSRNLKDPKVVVRVLDRSGRAATLLLGAVRNQQRFKLRRDVRLNELVALSGGITDAASGEITIARPADLNCLPNHGDQNKVSLMRFTISQVLSGANEFNPLVLSGDIITVVEAAPIYVIGGVNNPRQISSREEMTISRAISSAGGLAKEAIENDITIYRHDGKDARSINVDLKKIKAKQQEDLVLKPFDIVDVAEKGKGKPKFPPSINADAVSRDIYKLPVRIVE